MTNLSIEIEEAATRIRPFVRETWLEPAPEFATGRPENGTRAWMKLECLQHTGSFKLRGALNKLLGLTEAERNAGVVAASTGNHGLAVAFGLQYLGIQGTIVLPETAAGKKIELLKRYAVDLQFHGTDSAQAEQWARRQAGAHGQVFISPYNDRAVIAGQGTIGLELVKQMPDIDSVFAPVGGGGLISGIAAYLKAVRPSVRVFGCLPENSPVMHECIEAGKIVEGTVRPTLSDGTAGGLEADAITFGLCRDLVDDWIRVSEEEIRAGMQWIFERYGLVVEGAAGMNMAGFMQHHERIATGNTAVILCGGNVDIEQFKQLVC